MNEEYEKQIKKLKNDYEKLLNKKILEEREEILDNILKIIPEENREQIQNIINKRDNKETNTNEENTNLDILNCIGKMGEMLIFMDEKGSLYNDKAELIGVYKDKPYFHTEINDIDNELNNDTNIVNSINFNK